MRYITRQEWGAAYGRGHPTDGAKTLVVVHHDGPYPSRSQPGMSFAQEASICRLIEAYHVKGEPGKQGLTASNPRIAYTAIGMQGERVYEGCGWGYIGAHTAGMNSSSYGYFMPLAGDRDAPIPKAIAAFHEWREQGVKLGHLSPNHLVRGHQDFNKPSCPGQLVYAAMVANAQPVTVQPTIADVIASRPSLRLGKGGIFGTAAERAAVTYLQRRLVVLGFMAVEPTGYFGIVTDSAVRRFQKTKGLTVDGIVGKQTWGKLR